MENNLKKRAIVMITTVLLIQFRANAQQQEMLDSGELQIALQKLNVLGSVLFIAAHPDDENTSVLAYLSKGRKYRTAYLSLTRGDGGQNLIGPEKGAEIGIIRTQELMAARRIDGAEQFFTRAIDFGYSKTQEETFAFWGKEENLADVVWVIRKFRPDILITRFPPGSNSGHGHHTASGNIVQEAFHAAADPKAFPEQLKSVEPWRAKRLFWNSWRPNQEQREKWIKVDTGEYNPFLGKSYSEIAALSRSKHKSQGFGATGRRGTRNDYFSLLEGIPAKSNLFDGIDTSWNRIPGGQKIGRMLNEIWRAFDPQHPSKSVPKLLDVYTEFDQIEISAWIQIKKQELIRVIQSCAGLWMEAIADDYAAAPGDEMTIKATIVNRSDHPFMLDKLSLPKLASDSILNTLLENNDPVTIEETIHIPKNYPISQPYWLRIPPQIGLFSTPEQELIGLAENPPSICALIHLRINGHVLVYSVPLLFRWTDRVAGELYRRFEVRPSVTLELEEKVSIFPNNAPKDIVVKIKSHSPNVTGNIRLLGNEKWRISPATLPFSIKNKYEEKEITFKVSPPRNSDESFLTAEAEIAGEKVDRALAEIAHPHIYNQVYFPKCQLKAVKLDIKKLGEKLGYIMGAGDEVANGLQNLGYEVIFLNDDKLENNDLSQFDAIITGIRAYNTRGRLKHTHQKLLQYVNDGGTLIVQYNVSRGLIVNNIGPYPFTIGRDRVSVETAPVTFLQPDHQLLNSPNKITQRDFKDWIQERGLYFASQWSEEYETILSSHDPKESDKHGGLLFARYGKGIFIYTGYAWFRQLPAGVPGALRLLVNLISAGKVHGQSTN